MWGFSFFLKMRHAGLVLMGIILIFSGNGYADLCSTPRPDRLKITPDVSSFGYSAHIGNMTDNDYAMMKQAGVGFMRFDIEWDTIENDPGTYDFSSIDSAIGKMIANGIRPLGVLAYGNHNYKDGALTSDAWRAKFAAFAAAAAHQYAYLGKNTGKGMIFEIWNEPNGQNFWIPYPKAAGITPDGAAYAALLHAASVAIRAKDPNAAVIGPALSMLTITPWLTTFLSQKFSGQSILADMDGVSVHPYRFGKNAPPESAVDSYVQFRAALENAAGPCQRQLPIISSEWGYSSTSTSPWILTADQQAAYQLRSWLVNLTLGALPSLAYDWKNDGSDPAQIEQNFGAITAANPGVAKPLYTAASQLMNSLKGMTFVQRLTPQDQYDWRLLFRGNNKLAIVSWTADPRVKDMTLQTPSVQIIDASSATFNANQLLSAIQYPTDILMTAPGHSVNVKFKVYNYKTKQINVVMTAGLPAGSRTQTVSIAPQATSLVIFNVDLGKSRSNVPFTIPLTATIDGQAVPGLNSVQVRNFQPLIVKESMWGFVSLRVDISNPSGVAFDGYFNANVSLTDATGIVPVHLATGDLSTWVTVPLPKAATQYGQNILDASYNVISTGTESYVSFPQFKDAATIAANYTNNLLVQNTVMSTSAVTAPAMTGGPAHFYLNATYSFSGASGSMEQIYAAQNLNQTIPSGVRFLRFWLKGDGTANAVSMRFVDNTGQAFQMNGMGTAANTDWRLVEIPLDDYNPFFEFSSGGAGDGKIHFPIHWDSLLLIQSLTGACTGSVQISSPMYFY